MTFYKIGAIGELVPNLKPQPISQNHEIFHLFKPVYKYMLLILSLITPVINHQPNHQPFVIDQIYLDWTQLDHFT